MKWWTINYLRGTEDASYSAVYTTKIIEGFIPLYFYVNPFKVDEEMD